MWGGTEDSETLKAADLGLGKGGFFFVQSNHDHFKPYIPIIINTCTVLKHRWILVAGETVFNFQTTRARLRPEEVGTGHVSSKNADVAP